MFAYIFLFFTSWLRTPLQIFSTDPLIVTTLDHYRSSFIENTRESLLSHISHFVESWSDLSSRQSLKTATASDSWTGSDVLLRCTALETEEIKNSLRYVVSLFYRTYLKLRGNNCALFSPVVLYSFGSLVVVLLLQRFSVWVLLLLANHSRRRQLKWANHNAKQVSAAVAQRGKICAGQSQLVLPYQWFALFLCKTMKSRDGSFETRLKTARKCPTVNNPKREQEFWERLSRHKLYLPKVSFPFFRSNMREQNWCQNCLELSAEKRAQTDSKNVLDSVKRKTIFLRIVHAHALRAHTIRTKMRCKYFPLG